ncbi:hypothetical protein [Spirillospora sp. NPDC029432]|uniref:hypothetical protein n=1 Tax=Spirillospora sp. NPDC029432 TaxID=3154599 RepID=UPI00345598B0
MPSKKTLLLATAAAGIGLLAARPLRRGASQAFLYATGTVVRDERPAARQAAEPAAEGR